MQEKHFLFISDSITVAMRYDFDSKILVFGGLMRFRPNIMEVIVALLPSSEYSSRKMRPNKVRIEIPLEEKEYDAFVKALKENNIQIQQTKSFERVMR
jgi:hypothetical protein